MYKYLVDHCYRLFGVHFYFQPNPWLVEMPMFWAFRRNYNSPKGNGALAMQAVCDFMDTMKEPFCLFTSVPKLIPYYKSFGFFEVESDTPFTLMVRLPQ